MKIANQYRQGDVLLQPVDALPVEATKITGKMPIILAEGEATRHAHRIKRSRKVRHHIANGEMYLEVLEPVDLEHEEHAAITVDPGIYLVRRQVEVWLDEIRQVAD